MIKQLLKHAVSLEYLHWQNRTSTSSLSPPYRRQSYAQSVETTVRILEQLGLNKTELNRFQVISRQARITALISVIHHKQNKNSTLGQLRNPDFVRRILEFVTMCDGPRGVILETGDPTQDDGISQDNESTCMIM